MRDNIDKILSRTNVDSTYQLHVAIAYDPKDDINEFITNKDRKQSQMDLVVRSGREQRSSGFFPCHTLNSEWYYSDKLWPDMNEDDFVDAMKHYKSKDRRFGE